MRRSSGGGRAVADHDHRPVADGLHVEKLGGMAELTAGPGERGRTREVRDLGLAEHTVGDDQMVAGGAVHAVGVPYLEQPAAVHRVRGDHFGTQA